MVGRVFVYVVEWLQRWHVSLKVWLYTLPVVFGGSPVWYLVWWWCSVLTTFVLFAVLMVTEAELSGFLMPN